MSPPHGLLASLRMLHGTLSKPTRTSLVYKKLYGEISNIRFSKTNTLSNKYLTAKNGKVAVYPGVSAQSAGKFFTTEYKDKASGVSTTSFHFGDDTHQLGLSGKGGLLSLVDLVNPSAKTVDFSTPTEWSVFGISSSGNLEVKDGQSIPSRKWVTYLDTDGVQYVGLWDGMCYWLN